jgi:broad specificity phosphatase PhoE
VSRAVADASQIRPESERPSGAAPVVPSGLDAVLVLVRHGETEFIVQKRFQGRMEAPLSAAGEVQARLAGERIAAAHENPPLPVPVGPPLEIVHSPLARTRRTTELIVEALRDSGRPLPPVVPEPGLAEIGQGRWEGLREDEITARFGDQLAGWRRWPERVHAEGGEDLAAVFVRVAAALGRILGRLADGAESGTMDHHQVLGYGDDSADRRRWSILVGHGGSFRVVVCLLLGLPLEHFWNFDFALGSITVIDIRAGRAVLRAVNLDSHLAPPADPEAAAEVVRIAAESAERGASGAL